MKRKIYYVKIKRPIKHFYQRLTRGFDDSETWNLDFEISKFILPRLERFKEISLTHPTELTEKEWDDILDKMIYSFYMNTVINDLKIPEYQKVYDKIEDGFKLFSKYFWNLWW